MHNNVIVSCMGGKVNFTIYQTPLVEDHQDPGLQREYTPVVPENDGTGLTASVPLRLHEATETTKWKPATKNDLGADYLAAVKNGRGVAIRAHGATEGYRFRVKIIAGGVNVASPSHFKSSPPGTSYPDYFVMPNQQWVFGVRVGESSVRQFRVLEGGSWRFSLKSLYERTGDDSIEIQVTGYRRDQNTTDRYADLPLTATRTPGGSTIFVVSMSGKRVALEEMSSSDTVKNLRLRIQEEEGTSIHKQRIVFNGHQLEDERRLSDYSIGKGDTVHLVLQLSGGGYRIMSALSDLSETDDAKMSLKPEQLGPGGRIHQDFAIDLEPEDWEILETWTMRFYLFDADHVERETGLDLDPGDNVERQYQVDDFVQDRFPSFRGKQAAVSMPSIAQLYKQSKGEAQQDGRNLDCAQDEQDAGQQGNRNEEVRPRQRTSTPTQKQIRRMKLVSMIMCGMK